MTGCTLFEIVPKTPYTSEDLNWHNDKSRTSLEVKDKNSRPEIALACNDIKDSDIILLGFPIWWYCAPHIIQTFLRKL